MSASNRRALRTGLIVACALVAGALLGHRYSPVPHEQRDERVAPATPSDVVSSGVADNQPVQRAADSALDPPVPPIAPATLPHPTEPFATQLPVLLQLAARGDGTAGCRLALSLLRCHHVMHRRRFEAGFQRNLERIETRSDDAIIDSLARSSLDAGDYCDGIDVATLPRIDELPEMAWSSLTPWQKTQLAMTRADGKRRRLVRVPGTSSSQAMGFVMPALLARNTHRFLVDGYDARIPLALEGLVMLHTPAWFGPGDGLTVQLPDHRLFVQYGLLMQRLYGAEAMGRWAPAILQSVADQIPPEELAAINARVESEYVRWGGASPPPPPPARQAIEVDDATSYSCSETS